MIEPPQDGEVVVDLDRRVLPACAALFVDTFNAEPWNESWTLEIAMARFGDMLETPGYIGVALMAGHMVTGAALGQVESWFSGSHFYLREMFVRVDLQRQGRGERLLEGLMSLTPNIEATYLITDRDGPAAQFYHRHGFAPASSRVIMTRPRQSTNRLCIPFG